MRWRLRSWTVWLAQTPPVRSKATMDSGAAMSDNLRAYSIEHPVEIEPGMVFAPGKLMVHEENIAITEGPAELLSRRAAPEMPVIA